MSQQIARKNAQLISITLLSSGVTFEFNVDRPSYNSYINAITPTNKVQPSHNFLMLTVVPDSREALKLFLEETPSAEIAIASKVLEEYTPDLEFAVKKLSALQIN